MINPPAYILFAVLLAAVAAFCGFGFFASLEPLPDPRGGRIGYAIGFLGTATVPAADATRHETITVTDRCSGDVESAHTATFGDAILADPDLTCRR